MDHGWPEQGHPCRAPRRAPRRAARRRVRAPLLVAAVAAVAVAGTGVAGAGDLDVPVLRDVVRPRAYVEVDGQAVAVPRPPRSDGRVLPPVSVTTSGDHAFLHVTEDGEPVGYDPCRPVRWVVRPDGEPEGGREVVVEAVRIVSEASGLELEALGETDEAPAMERALIQPERYGDGWAPVLVAWADEDAVPELAGQVAGVGGSAAVPGASGRGTWLAAGRVVLDAPDLAAMMERPGGREQARAIIVHELAHVLGLDHVEDPEELMHPMTSGRTDLGPGDREGLARLGQVSCED